MEQPSDMAIVHFLGRILPDTLIQISIGHKPIVKWESPDIGLTMEFTNHIEKSQIDVECKLNRYTPNDFLPVYMRAMDLCRASVDLVAFTKGYGLTVVLETFVDPTGATSSLLFKDDSLAPLCSALTLSSGFDEVHTMVLTDVGLFMALNDLVGAITLPHVSTVNCARALEGLRHLIAPPGINNKEAWGQMRQALQVDEAYLKLITDNSTASRHGDRTHVPGDTTAEITRRSWVIMNRFFEYRKGGSKPLSAPDFPLLHG
jgi:hypothetical protein